MQLIIKLKTQNSKSVSNIVKTQKMYIHNHKNTTAITGTGNTHRCEQLTQGCYVALPRVGFEPATY